MGQRSLNSFPKDGALSPKFLSLAQRVGKGGDFASTTLFFFSTPAFISPGSSGHRSTYVLWGVKDRGTQQAQL